MNDDEGAAGRSGARLLALGFAELSGSVEEEHGKRLDVRVPLRRDLEELHARPLDVVNDHCNAPASRYQKS